MFSKILYPTDFSEPSKKAVKYVKKLKEAGTKEAIVLYVIANMSLAPWLRAVDGLEEIQRNA